MYENIPNVWNHLIVQLYISNDENGEMSCFSHLLQFGKRNSKSRQYENTPVSNYKRIGFRFSLGRNLRGGGRKKRNIRRKSQKYDFI